MGTRSMQIITQKCSQKVSIVFVRFIRFPWHSWCYLLFQTSDLVHPAGGTPNFDCFRYVQFSLGFTMVVYDKIYLEAQINNQYIFLKITVNYYTFSHRSPLLRPVRIDWHYPKQSEMDALPEVCGAPCRKLRNLWLFSSMFWLTFTMGSDIHRFCNRHSGFVTFAVWKLWLSEPSLTLWPHWTDWFSFEVFWEIWLVICKCGYTGSESDKLSAKNGYQSHFLSDI